MLWRRMSRVLSQILACLAHGDARAAGRGADVGNHHEQGVGLHQKIASSRSGMTWLSLACPVILAE